MRGALAIALALAGLPAAAHDGFEALEQRGVECCGGHDCRVIPDSWIEPTADHSGYNVRVPAGAWPEKFPIAYFPGGYLLSWQGEPGFSPSGETVGCVISQYGSSSYGVDVLPYAHLRCLFAGGLS